MITADTAIYRVDFNAVHPETWQVLGTADSAEGQGIPPKVGDRVLLRDAEENHCWAWIASVDGDRLRFDLDQETWRSGPEQFQLAYAGSTSLPPRAS